MNPLRGFPRIVLTRYLEVRTSVRWWLLHHSLALLATRSSRARTFFGLNPLGSFRCVRTFFGLNPVRSFPRIVCPLLCGAFPGWLDPRAELSQEFSYSIPQYFSLLAATKQLVSIGSHEIDALEPSLVLPCAKLSQDCSYSILRTTFLAATQPLARIASHEIDKLGPSLV